VELEGKVAIVTGASAGIGRAYALALAGAGATVVAAARSLGRAEDGVAPRGTLAEVVRAAQGLPGRVYAQVCDIEREADIARLMEQAAANFGRIDVLVNNAAIYPHYDTLGLTPDEWDLNMRVNVRGPYLAIRHAAPQMMRQGAGSIVNLTSLSALPTPRGSAAHEGLMVYGVSKAAVNRLTTYMAEELKPHGIAVNGLSPGGVLTDTWARVDPAAFAAAKETATGKPATPEVMGPALIYLAQQTAQTMTGQIVHTDQFRKSWP
jgi:NAD(P)-dependent dehydrogenase (short-subunit alcohol dehydrogenase family)